MISARTASPFRSMEVTSISSTMHFRVSPAWRASLQVDWSSAAHWPTNWPCKDHLCSSDTSVIVIFSTTRPLTARQKLPTSQAARPTTFQFSLQFFPQLPATAEYVHTPVNGFCADDRHNRFPAIHRIRYCTRCESLQVRLPLITKTLETSIRRTRKD